MEPETLNKLMQKNKISYELINPDYDEWLNTGALDVESVELLKLYASLNTLEKVEMIRKNELISKIFLNATYATGPGLLRSYSLQHLSDICRVDNGIYNILLKILDGRDVYSIYYDIATHEKDKKIVEKTLYLLTGKKTSICIEKGSNSSLCSDNDRNWSRYRQRLPKQGFIAYGNGCFKDEEAESVVKLILKLSIDNYSKLYSLSNILQLKTLTHPNSEKYHNLIENENVLRLLKINLGKENAPNTQYKCVFCVWLISRSEEYIPVLHRNELVHLLCTLLSSTKIEKVIRICILVFNNLLKNPQCLEVMVEMNVIQTLTLLAYDKWNDSELYDNIHKLHMQLENKTFKLSNFERYCSELNSGQLKWSILHSEKFWLLHNEKFEHDEFINISKLVDLLDSNDSTTVSIACFDLGEFARLYRNGKKICKKFKVKDKVMDLITNKDRDIARQAMLCAQKLMVQHWQQVATQ
ncbi:vacuolar ATP synthase subunit H [Theileria orientalis strain Shintoku]|uniref:V-type proton ATPase subunit H n=1 Tax=Theileria orientalis strain Shintoku TaxID=869250 RepID=J4C451_THEOR|nr:vacuolar ATP synthase subunit H [Theileria orientalis strain Shintoku]BAM41576.1 vacuolar ATP synthase subunit H [Theileria orientalis strain Shintoku]|eukprot:XP_009691877.1 vacuolar ATP synthase subunit H [Theileria orientalis strain Shintoku]